MLKRNFIIDISEKHYLKIFLFIQHNPQIQGVVNVTFFTEYPEYILNLDCAHSDHYFDKMLN